MTHWPFELGGASVAAAMSLASALPGLVTSIASLKVTTLATRMSLARSAVSTSLQTTGASEVSHVGLAGSPSCTIEMLNAPFGLVPGLGGRDDAVGDEVVLLRCRRLPADEAPIADADVPPSHASAAAGRAARRRRGRRWRRASGCCWRTRSRRSDRRIEAQREDHVFAVHVDAGGTGASGRSPEHGGVDLIGQERAHPHQRQRLAGEVTEIQRQRGAIGREKRGEHLDRRQVSTPATAPGAKPSSSYSGPIGLGPL